MYNSYDDIRREYEVIRQNDYLRYDEKKEEIYSKNPGLKELDSQIVKIFVEIAKASLDKKITNELEHKLKEIQSRRNQYLKEHNIKDDYKEVKYVCDKCKDTGFVDGVKCSCYIQKEIELFDNISHFKKYIVDDNFEKLDLNFYNQSGFNVQGISYKKHMEELVIELKNMVAKIDTVPFSLLLIGPTGTGKTFLARCMGANALKNNKSVLYVNVNEYLNSLKPDYEGESLKYYAISCDLFILDDLGTERITDYTSTELNYIIDKRLNDKKSTIITTNLLPEQIGEVYLQSTYSRLENAYDNRYLAGDDLRRLKNVNF